MHSCSNPPLCTVRASLPSRRVTSSACGLSWTPAPIPTQALGMAPPRFTCVECAQAPTSATTIRPRPSARAFSSHTGCGLVLRMAWAGIPCTPAAVPTTWKWRAVSWMPVPPSALSTQRASIHSKTRPGGAPVCSLSAAPAYTPNCRFTAPASTATTTWSTFCWKPRRRTSKSSTRRASRPSPSPAAAASTFACSCFLHAEPPCRVERRPRKGRCITHASPVRSGVSSHSSGRAHLSASPPIKTCCLCTSPALASTLNACAC
mmetsp:Transcript_14730/g.44960  ORF Transcript_14730/g.44960 Transcript_14730/m.44960 type:complete len:262 (-) Transcript_14730:995-1780(-)